MPAKATGVKEGCAATAAPAGVHLAAVLQQLGVKSVQQGARWVHFAGPDDELPGGSSYATCLDLEHCLNPANDVLLAYKQNGRWAPR